MPSTVTTTIGSSHTDTTVQAWANTLNGLNLVVADQIQEGSCYNDTEFAVAGIVADFSGEVYTADATRYPVLDTGAGQSFRDNANVRTNALYYNQANGVGLRNTGTGLYTIDTHGVNSIIIRNLQIKGDAGTRAPLVVGGTAPSAIVENCIVVGGELEVNGTATFNNCLFVNTLVPFGRIIETNTASTITCNYCTFIATTPVTFYVAFDAAATFNFVNCAFFGGGTSSFSTGTGTTNFTNCMTDITGTTGLTGGKTFANQFTSTTNDFRTKAGADLINAGTPVGGITTDISGFTRSVSTPTIGAWEFDSGGGGGGSGGGGLLLFGGSVGWTSALRPLPLLGAAALWAGEKIRRNGTVARRTLIGKR